MNEEDKQKIKVDVQESFIERMRSAISEKITYCIKEGFTEDEASHTVIQIVKNLPNHLLPLKIIVQEQDDEDISNENIENFARFIA